MAVHAFDHQRLHKSSQRLPGDQLLRLGWPHFWVLTAILGGMLALVGFVMLAYR
jgi:hypothetical protein